MTATFWLGDAIAGGFDVRRLTLRRTAGKGLPRSRGKHGADLNLAVTLDAVPYTVPGTHAGRVSRSTWRSSTGCLPIRRWQCGVSPAVRVRGMSPPGADLQLLRSRPDLLRRRLC